MSDKHCQALTKSNIQCSRLPSNKNNHDHLYCYQHQSQLQHNPQLEIEKEKEKENENKIRSKLFIKYYIIKAEDKFNYLAPDNEKYHGKQRKIFRDEIGTPIEALDENEILSLKKFKSEFFLNLFRNKIIQSNKKISNEILQEELKEATTEKLRKEIVLHYHKSDWINEIIDKALIDINIELLIEDSQIRKYLELCISSPLSTCNKIRKNKKCGKVCVGEYCPNHID